jgi:hypothetical protein
VALPVVQPQGGRVAAEKPDKINWDRLSSNPCGDAVKLLRENPKNRSRSRKRLWKSDRSAAKTPRENQLGLLVGQHLQQTVSMLREYPDKINWNILSFNPQTG